MKTYKEYLQVDVDDILCDRCGKSCKCYPGGDLEGLFASSFGGYHSWFDEMTITVDLCQDCLKDLLLWIYPGKTIDEILTVIQERLYGK